VIVLIFKKDVVQHALYFEFMINFFIRKHVSNALIFLCLKN
jgi:hypothetical protein